jgi:hypothetical protein
MSFNLANYEPVEDRLARFWADHKGGRVITEMVPAPDGQWIIKTSVWRSGTTAEPDATGYAHEVVGSSGVNRTSALENCETSSIGRALANLGYAPKGARPSREEMTKVDQAPPARLSVTSASASAKQLETITKLMPSPEWVADWKAERSITGKINKAEASALIEDLIALKGEQG